MVLILKIDEKIVDFGGSCCAEEFQLFWRALNGQTKTTDQLNWNVGDVEIESGVGSKVSHAATLALLFAPQVVQTVHRLECHDFLSQVSVHVDQKLV